MLSLQDALLNWADELEQYRAPSWEMLPDIDLYMDQVITLLERNMSIFSRQNGEKAITPSMINNYVKNHVIPRPVQKKYTREHLTCLIAVLNLKQVLSLSDITALITKLTAEKPMETLLAEFEEMQNEAFGLTSARVKEILENTDADLNEEEVEARLNNLALKMSLEANSYSMAAKTILDKIMVKKKTPEGKDKAKDKDNKSKDKVKT